MPLLKYSKGSGVCCRYDMFSNTHSCIYLKKSSKSEEPPSQTSPEWPHDIPSFNSSDFSTTCRPSSKKIGHKRLRAQVLLLLPFLILPFLRILWVVDTQTFMLRRIGCSIELFLKKCSMMGVRLAEHDWGTADTISASVHQINKNSLNNGISMEICRSAWFAPRIGACKTILDPNHCPGRDPINEPGTWLSM